MPVLTGWASQYTSLREVTRYDIPAAVDARHGPVIQHCIVALRSLFRALRQERVIFRDPTRRISLPALARLPQPLPADRVAGLLDRAGGPAAQLAVALVGIHAVPVADLIRLQAADLDLAAGTLTIRQGYRHRIVYLDEVTAALASRWLRYRHRRWPVSRNPHLPRWGPVCSRGSEPGPLGNRGQAPLQVAAGLVRFAGDAAHRHGRGDDHVSELIEQVLTGPADALPLVQPVDAQECLGHLADLLRPLQQPDLDGNVPVVCVQLADLVPHMFLPKLGDACSGSVP
jgi:integrase